MADVNSAFLRQNDLVQVRWVFLSPTMKRAPQARAEYTGKDAWYAKTVSSFLRRLRQQKGRPEAPPLLLDNPVVDHPICRIMYIRPVYRGTQDRRT